MEVVETSVFTRSIESLLDEDEYRALQTHLVENPESGSIIPGSGGIRKLRWGLKGKGKRGGGRVVYFWAVRRDRILMLYAFAKNEREDLSKEQLSLLKKAVEAEFKNEG
ncbi:MAG: type II toxin-antitoxin system RelE/ParE family toxin [Candidatus Omnitrophica bacterium]|nr:type II toxin-antitoxin system RelE/ParE family toxin [Candidatus Omnitrophota bacterium]